MAMCRLYKKKTNFKSECNILYKFFDLIFYLIFLLISYSWFLFVSTEHHKIIVSKEFLKFYEFKSVTNWIFGFYPRNLTKHFILRRQVELQYFSLSSYLFHWFQWFHWFHATLMFVFLCNRHIAIDAISISYNCNVPLSWLCIHSKKAL